MVYRSKKEGITIQPIPTALTISGTDPTGGAGIQADLKIFQELKNYGMSVITSVVAQNTTGVRDVHHMPVSMIEVQLDSIIEVNEGITIWKKLFYRTGTGLDVHGQDVNVAASRAVKDAIHYNSMPGIRSMLPDGDLNNMKVNVKLAIPQHLEQLEPDKIKELIPYGQVTIEVVTGGMATTSDIFLEGQRDKKILCI